MTISKSETGNAFVYSMGMKSYVTSTVVFENAKAAVILLRQTLEAVQRTPLNPLAADSGR
jgi:hypothetical protein